jgi:hypothetical protein
MIINKVSVLGGVEEAAEKLKNDLGMTDISWCKVEPPLVMDQVPAWKRKVERRLSGSRKQSLGGGGGGGFTPWIQAPALPRCLKDGIVDYEPFNPLKDKKKNNHNSDWGAFISHSVDTIRKTVMNPEEVASFPLYLQAFVVALIAVITTLLWHLENVLFSEA